MSSVADLAFENDVEALTELRGFLGWFDFDRDFPNLFDDSPFLLFHDPAVVGEGADSKSAQFRASPLQEKLAVWTN